MFDSLMTIGTFDVPHAGHAAFLMSCEAHTERLIIGVNSDDFVASFKQQPLFNQKERIDLLREMGYENVVLNDGPGDRLIKMYRPDCVAIGTDWMNKDYLKQIGLTEAWFTTSGTALLYLPYTVGISTSEIRRRVLQNG